MSVNFQQFLLAYSIAAPEIKTLIDSDEIGIFADKVLNRPGDLPQKRQIIVSISNRILNITADSDMVDELEKVNLTTELIAQSKAFVEQKLALTIQKHYTQYDLIEDKKTLPPINSVRTMATDGAQVGYQSADEPVYTSVQSALLNESK